MRQTQRFQPINDQRGFVSAVFLIMMASILITMIACIDVIRWSAVQNRMQFAVDTAALAAGASLQGFNVSNSTQSCAWQQNTAAYYRMNMPSNYMGSSISALTTCSTNSSLPNSVSLTDNPNATQGGVIITINAAGSVPLAVSRLIGGAVPSLPTGAQAQALRINQGALEIAMALDNSGSMAEEECEDDGNACSRSASNTTIKINDLATDASALVNQFIPTSGSGNVYIGLVPFTTTVNVRTASQALPLSLLDQTRTDAAGNRLPATAPFTSTTWNGCVSEASPLSSSTLSGVSGAQVALQSPSSPGFRAYFDGWTDSTVNGTPRSYSYTNFSQSWCVQAPTVFLTRTTGTLTSALSAMQHDVLQPTNSSSGSTFIATGLLWAWRMLDDLWNGGMWGGSLPVASISNPVKKVIILITDGDNAWQLPASSFQAPNIALSVQKNGSYSSSTDALGTPNDGGYGGSGGDKYLIHTTDLTFTASKYRPSLNPFSTASIGTDVPDSPDSTQAITVQQYMELSLCRQAAANGITIYAIVLGSDSATSGSITTLQQCVAYSGGQAFPAPSASALQADFNSIYGQLNALRLLPTNKFWSN